MNESQLSELATWITKAGLIGRAETAMLAGFCERAVASGLPIGGAVVVIDTLHPLHEGHAMRWYRDEPEATRVEYGRTNEGEAAENYRRSPMYRLVQSGEPFLRRRLGAEAAAEFPMLDASLKRGMTDYLAILNRFAAEGVVGEMDCVYSGWESDRPEGFEESDIAALRRLSPFLALAMKCATLGRIAQALAETYLGRDAGRLVLSGRILRGIAERIETVL
jgi:adenylate cyclase